MTKVEYVCHLKGIGTISIKVPDDCPFEVLEEILLQQLECDEIKVKYRGEDGHRHKIRSEKDFQYAREIQAEAENVELYVAEVGGEDEVLSPRKKKKKKKKHRHSDEDVLSPRENETDEERQTRRRDKEARRAAKAAKKLKSNAINKKTSKAELSKKNPFFEKQIPGAEKVGPLHTSRINQKKTDPESVLEGYIWVRGKSSTTKLKWIKRYLILIPDKNMRVGLHIKGSPTSKIVDEQIKLDLSKMSMFPTIERTMSTAIDETYTFALTFYGRPPIMFKCDDNQSMKIWMTEIRDIIDSQVRLKQAADAEYLHSSQIVSAADKIRDGFEAPEPGVNLRQLYNIAIVEKYLKGLEKEQAKANMEAGAVAWVAAITAKLGKESLPPEIAEVVDTMMDHCYHHESTIMNSPERLGKYLQKIFLCSTKHSKMIASSMSLRDFDREYAAKNRVEALTSPRASSSSKKKLKGVKKTKVAKKWVAPPDDANLRSHFNIRSLEKYVKQLERDQVKSDPTAGPAAWGENILDIVSQKPFPEGEEAEVLEDLINYCWYSIETEMSKEAETPISQFLQRTFSISEKQAVIIAAAIVYNDSLRIKKKKKKHKT